MKFNLMQNLTRGRGNIFAKRHCYRNYNCQFGCTRFSTSKKTTLQWQLSGTPPRQALRGRPSRHLGFLITLRTESRRPSKAGRARRLSASQPSNGSDHSLKLRPTPQLRPLARCCTAPSHCTLLPC